jgi:sugar lactone lactonase YvrE
MNLIEEGRPTGNFYRIDPNLTVTKISSGLRIPNGLAWSPDDSAMLHTDTCGNVVWHYEFDPATGSRRAEQPFFHFDAAATGGVDGAAMDVEGGYWAALYGSGKLLRLLPNGTVDREIALPVSQPTMPAFVGCDMTTLFITSAYQNLTHPDLRAQPLAGSLLAVETDVVGHPVHAFGG